MVHPGNGTALQVECGTRSNHPAPSGPGNSSLSLAELLASLSCALDLTEGQPMGHAVRTCLIGLRLADELQLTEQQVASLHLTLLLKDAGCSSNAARMFALFGCDDLLAKKDAKVRDWCRISEAVQYAARHTAPGASFPERLRKMVDLLRLPGRVMDVLTEARCTRGADIARACGLGEEAAEAILNLDEHWDGQGAPQRRAGVEIPLLARIACLAQTMEVFAATYGVEGAYKVARSRAGRWFDPEIVRAAEGFESDTVFWQAAMFDPRALLADRTGPLLQGRLSEVGIDRVCDAFAVIVDAKSPFTAAHSSRVADVAVRMADHLGLSEERRVTLRRAALLHDLGKLAVPNTILDKPGELTPDEFAIIKRHPLDTERVLLPISAWSDVTRIAVAHHEKLDGSGYCRGWAASDLDLDMRVLAVADMYDAITTSRPYREAMPIEDSLALLSAEAERGRLDSDCVAAVRDCSSGACPIST